MTFNNTFLTYFKVTLYSISTYKAVIIRICPWLFKEKLNEIRFDFIIKNNTREITMTAGQQIKNINLIILILIYYTVKCRL